MSDPAFDGRAFRCIDRFRGCRILVVGDIMLDEYVWGTVGRISPEAPVPIVAVTRDSRALGGAANVAVNIAGLGAKAELAGFVGRDAAGREVQRMLRRAGVGVGALVPDAGRPTTVKTRVIAHNQQVVRVDREKNGASGARAGETLRKRVRDAVRAVDGVVLSDYRKGVLSREFVAEIIAAARRRGIFVAVDPKQADFSYYRGCSLITPNRAEAEAALGGKELSTDLEIHVAGKALLRKSGAEAILITRGAEGMSLVERGRKASFHIPAQARKVFDVTGAGDTVIGTLAAALCAGATMRDAARLANVAAGVVVADVGTVPIRVGKLVHELKVRGAERDVAAGEQAPRPPGKGRRGTDPR